MVNPVLSAEWQTEEIRSALAEIKPPHVLKKHTTLILIAFATAAGDPVAKVFERDDTCADNVWYGLHRRNGTYKVGWRDVPEIKRAYELVLARALTWRDQETIEIEAAQQQKRRRAIAEYSAVAPKALYAVMASDEQRGADRINAAMKLIGLADPSVGGYGVYSPVGGSGDTNQTVNIDHDHIDTAIERELARLAAGGQASASAPAAEPAQPDLDPTAGTADAGLSQ